MALMVEMQKIPERKVIAVTGEDATSFLQGLVTNGPPTEGGCFSALLTPQGKILFDFFIVRAQEGFLLDVHENAAEALIKRLKLYRLRAKIDIDIDDAHGVFLSPDLANTGEDTFTNHPKDTTKSRLIAPINEFPNAVPDSEYHARRILAGVPEWGADFNSDEVFPMDMNFDALSGVDYKKGCFVGQEVASRMKRKGEARKRTLIAEFDGPSLKKGASIVAGDSTIGEILSGVDNMALALIRLDRWEKAKAAGDIPKCDDHALRLSIPAYLKQA